ncbi:MAG: sensor histidine kinase [Candidatus Obscuribacterales bacterium]|nr:sensor histidine kinase [Candidatus Obscuribacterales bacterium]
MKRSIRKKLVLWLAVPLGLLWLVSTTAGYYLALKFANDTYDRELVNSSDSVVARIKVKNDHLFVDLPPAAQAILRHDNSDLFLYRVQKLSGEKLSGDAVLPKAPSDLSETLPQFRTVLAGSNYVRLAERKVFVPEADSEPIIVQVAETLHSRKQLSTQIFMSIFVPQLLMMLLGATALWIGVGRGLEPLQFLQAAIAKRSRLDLSPVSEDIAPKEVYPLVISINDLLSRLREDIKAQQRFIANASHQLRTPLAGLKTYSSVGLSMSNPDEMRNIIKQLDTGLDRTTHLVNQLLALARSDPGTINYENAGSVDLNFVVSDVISNYVSFAISKKIDLAFEFAQESNKIKGDATSLQQLVANLLDNALKYTPVEGKVCIRLLAENKRVILSVSDNGPGIPAAEREKVFERFYRVLGSAANGSGLGLSIVKEVAVNHQAEISMSDENGQGTVVRISFPAPQA